MSEILEKINEVLGQAYVLYPTILVFITSVLLPTLIKIFQATKQTKKLIELANTAIDNNTSVMNGSAEMYEMFIQFLETQIEQDRQELITIINKKQRQAKGERVSQNENLLALIKSKKVNFGITPLTNELKSKVKKIRVKKSSKETKQE